MNNKESYGFLTPKKCFFLINMVIRQINETNDENELEALNKRLEYYKRAYKVLKNKED